MRELTAQERTSLVVARDGLVSALTALGVVYDGVHGKAEEIDLLIEMSVARGNVIFVVQQVERLLRPGK